MLGKYFIQTFGCQMNQADSEKVNMVLLQSGFFKANSKEDADIVIFNTCSVRQKGEDRVFGIIREIEKNDSLKNKKTLIGVTGCMVKKTGIAKRYIPEEYVSESKKRKTAKKIDYIVDFSDIYNYEDKLLPRSSSIDFVFRIEETKYIPHILSSIKGKKIGAEDKFDDYLKQVQQRENPFSASVIIQTGCDNYCSFCIVPYTRGKEISRNHDEIVTECREAVKNGAKEITLLGQNVNSYGKQSNLKLWNEEKSKWNNTDKNLKIGIDLDDTLFIVLSEELLESYNQKYRDIVTMDDIDSFDCGGIKGLMEEYHLYETKNALELKIHHGGEEVLKRFKKNGYTLYVITSREVSFRGHTNTILETYFGQNFFEEIIFIKESGHDNKYEAANSLNLDVVIDDGPHHIKAYKENFKGKIFVFEAPWNRDVVVDNKKVFRVQNWYEFESKLDSFTNTSPFRKLLSEIDTIKGLDRIRFTSSNPHDMTKDILASHFDLNHTCNYLHFALQSGNNELLKKMNRRHTYEDFKDMVYYLRSKDPLFSISTDIIVGFSGETDAMFEDTVKAFKECMFDFSYTARYSVRKETLASKLYPDDVPDSVKAERWHILNNLLLKNIEKRNSLMIGRTEEVLISGVKDDQFYGRTRNFKEVFFERSDRYKIGDIVKIRIVELDKYVLVGSYL